MKSYFMKEATNPYIFTILMLLQMGARPLTTSQVAARAGMSWSTAKAYLLKLQKTGKVKREKLGNKIYWSLPP